MANTLTSISGDLFKAAEIVGQEGVGFINSVMLNSGSEAVAKGQTVKSIKTSAPTVNSSVTPSMTIPEGDDQSPTQPEFTVSQVANTKINITGEEERHINTNYSFDTYWGVVFLQHFRALRNTIESYMGSTIYKSASRAFGTAGTTPFGSNFNEIPEIRQILFDNGFMMPGEVSLVINSLAGTNLRQLAQLQKVNESGGDDMLRRGELLNLQGLSIKESAGIASHTAGTGTSYQTSAAEALTSTTINLDTGSGTILAGDVLTFTGDSINKYVVNTALSGGSLTIGAPGIRSAVADNIAAAVGSAYTANVALARPCVEAVVRPLAAPSRGDAATDVLQVPDPISGIVYEVREYGGFHKGMWSISLVYDVKVWQPEGVAVLIG